MKNENHITAEALRELVDYDPITGLFTSREGLDIAFDHREGYVLLNLGGALYRANRMAWLYMTGEEPKGEVDHIDFDNGNNAWKNLRDISPAESRRYRRIWARKALKMKGVKLIKTTGQYGARIQHNGKRYSLGHHDTPDLAAHAYNKAAILHFGEFAVLNPVGRANYGPRGLIPERRRYLNEAKEKRPRGFAAMSPERRLELQRKGGKASQATGKVPRYSADNPERASAAGKKGSAALHAKNRTARKAQKELEAMKKGNDNQGDES